MTSVSANRAAETLPGSWRAWKQSLRLPSFSATIAPILVGAAYAWALGVANLALVALMLVAAVACQAGANLANDYYDHLRGVDSAEQPGSSLVIQHGLLTPDAVRRGMVAAFLVATILGFVIVALTGLAILLLALACLAVAVFYTAGPNPLGYVALGEVAVFLTLGIALVAGSVLALTGTITAMTIVIALPNAFLITAILHVNNVRDVARDQAAGKRTVAIMLGRQRSTRLYGAMLAASYVSTLLIVVLSPAFWPVLLTASTSPRALALYRSVVVATSEAEFSRALRGTNRVLFEVGCLLAVGIVIGAALSPRSLAL